MVNVPSLPNFPSSPRMPSLVPTYGLVSYWTMEDISGNTLKDIWGSNDGTIHGAEFTTSPHEYYAPVVGDIDGDGFVEIDTTVKVPIVKNAKLILDENFSIDNSANWTFTNNYGTWTWDTTNKQLVYNSTKDGYDSAKYNGYTVPDGKGVFILMEFSNHACGGFQLELGHG